MTRTPAHAKVRRVPPGLITLALGGTLLAATWALLDPTQLPTVAMGGALIAAALAGGHAIDALAARHRLSRFGRVVRKLLAAQAPTAAAARDLGRLPWFIVLSASAPDQPQVSPGRDGVFAHLNPRAPASVAILLALRALHPRAPIAGVILSLPADRLIVQPPADIRRLSGLLADQLDAIRSTIKLRFPVTIAITHTHCLRGFSALASAAGSANILGWANPAPLDSAAPIATFDDAIDRIREDLRRARLNLLTSGEPGPAPLARADELFTLADKAGLLAPPLRTLAAALAPIHIRDSNPRFFLRGLYLTSGRTFLPALLHERLLPERGLVCPQRRRARAPRHTPAIAAAALLAPALALSLTLVLRAAGHTAAATPSRHAAAPSAILVPVPPAPVPQRAVLAHSLRSRASAALARVSVLVRDASHSVANIRAGLPRVFALSLSSPAAIAARADQFARSAPAAALPTFPCATPPHLPSQFRADVARAIFSDFESVAPALSGPELDRFTAAFSAYADEYVHAWSSIAEPRIVPAPWPEFRQALTQINPARVNRDAHDLLFAVAEAMSLVPTELGQDEPIAAARAAITRQTAALDLSWFDQACRRTCDKWAALDPAEARAAILRLSRSRFQADYLEVYAEPGQPGSRYWSNLILAALSSIADTSAPRAAAAAFIQNTRAYPLCSSASRTLQPSDLAAARDYASAIIRTGLSTSTPDDALPLSRGVRTDFPGINDQLARLIGESAFEGDARDQWAYRLRAVLNFLDQPQTCTIVLLDPSEQTPIDGATPAAVQIPQFDLTLDADPPLGPFFTDRSADPGIAFDLPGPDLSFTFRSNQGPIAIIRLPKPWNAVSLLHQSGATIDDRSDPSGRLVKAPLIFTDPSGNRWCYWIGLRFQRPPPALAQWPSDADWPE